ncbi:MAG TPA: periplasmic heavy metal sensor [Acidobacteriota bacterium]
MKSRLWIVLLVVSMGINVGFLIHGLWPKHRHGKMAGGDCVVPGWHASPMMHGLGLSSQQAQQLEAERRQVLAQARPLQDELRRKRRELFVLLKNKTVSDSELDPILSEIARLQTGIEKMFILHSLKVRGYFSPAQMHKFENYLERELCPGMASAAFCPPGEMPGRQGGRAGWQDRQNEKKVN